MGKELISQKKKDVRAVHKHLRTISSANKSIWRPTKEEYFFYDGGDYVTLDENGSFREDIYERFDAPYHSWQICKYDMRGNLIEIEQYEEMDGETTMLLGEIYEYTYDSNTDVPLQVLSYAYNSDNSSYEPVMKVIYSGIIDASAGVNEITAQPSSLAIKIQDNTLTASLPSMNHYRIMSISGTLIFEGYANETVNINISTLPAGAYLFQANSPNGSQTTKFLK